GEKIERERERERERDPNLDGIHGGQYSNGFGTARQSKMIRLFPVLALAVGICLANPLSERESREFLSYRLPNATVPTHYNLYLDTDVHIGVFEYTGNVQISITVLERTQQIVLHSIRNVINRLEVRNSNQLAVALSGYDFDEDKQFLIVNTKEVLAVGTNYVLDIDFTNSLERNDWLGFYRTSYETAEGEIRYLGVTQFQACSARSAFPCYDEPGIKTTYDVKIACGVEYNAKANSPAVGITLLPNGKKLTTFQRTPRMQTYIVAFLVSDFASERQVVNEPNQLAISTVARPTAKDQLTYSVEASVRFLRAFEEYFDYSYSLSKMDNVAIRDSDFYFGAMENWGLVTYRESYIVFDSATVDETRKVSAVRIIGHEYTHQFFGNLLAPKWWSYLWLNEGFAQLYEYYLTELSHPELKMRERFASVRENALRTDASATVRPMTHWVETPGDITRLFDGIAYAKSGSVLRMFNYAFTEATFRKGLQYYIKQNKDNGVVADQNLFDSLAQAVEEDGVLPPGMTVHEVVGSWSNQPGAPVVNVKRIGDTNTFSFNQERFYDQPQDNPEPQYWWIPISYFTPSSNGIFNSSAAFWLPADKQEMEYQIELLENDFVLINPLATGYYRVNYDPQTWESIIYNLYENTGSIDKVSRSQLVDDSMNLAHAGQLDYYTAFKIFDYLQYEVEYVPWATASTNLKFLKRMLRNDWKALKTLESYAAQLTANIFLAYGYETSADDSTDIKDVRSIALEWGCEYDPQCQTEAATRFENIRKKSFFSFKSKAEQLIVCTKIRDIGYNDYISLLESFKGTPDYVERSHFLEAFACIRNKSIMREYLNDIMTNTFKGSEKLQALQTLYQASSEGMQTVMELIDNSTNLLKQLNSNRRETFTFLENLAEYTVDPASAAQLTNVVQREAPELLETVQAKLQYNQNWFQRNAAIVSEMIETPSEVTFEFSPFQRQLPTIIAYKPTSSSSQFLRVAPRSVSAAAVLKQFQQEPGTYLPTYLCVRCAAAAAAAR
ncbi:aminopeptidase N-like, partial [Sabethes cyaneus]|uniref:aminopeptidase N-like n=1 Tax=Sabethes cyaneus TaxID=53552 RepID=UPI00237E0FA7